MSATREGRPVPATREALALAMLEHLRPGIARPSYDPSKVGIGIVHLGPGAFHRAHQAWIADALLARDPRWGISAVSLKSPGVRDALLPQDGLYTVAVLDEAVSYRVIGSLREVLVADEDRERVLARIAAPATRVITLTITEKGYCLDGNGELDLDHPDIAHDLASPRRPASAIGVIVEGLRRRQAAGLPPPTVISCDNLVDNGRRLARAVSTLAFAQRDLRLASWIASDVAFPRTMVDSIVPATDDTLRTRVAEATGLHDRWPVQRESFLQWVIEKHANVDGPDWASAGVTLTDDVPAFVAAKLRLLNGAHSSLAYLGLLLGHETVAGAMADAGLAGFVRTMMTRDILPTLNAPEGLDLPRYIEAILQRFRNPAIRHELAQIAWDGSQKIPFRLLGTIRDSLVADRPIAALCVPVAAWLQFLRRRAAGSQRVVDPLAEPLFAIGRACHNEARHDLPAFLALDSVFPNALRTDPRFRAALADAYDALAEAPVNVHALLAKYST